MSCYHHFGSSDDFFIHPEAVNAVPEGKLLKEVVFSDLPLFTEEVLLEKIKIYKAKPANYFRASEGLINSCINYLKKSGKKGLPFIGPFNSIYGEVRVESACLSKGSKVFSTI